MNATPDALGRALVLLSAMSVAGIAHVLWLSSAASERFARPLDGGRCWRGRRLLGDHKCWRGLMVLPPVSAIAFWALAVAGDDLPSSLAAGLWPISPGAHAALGLACGTAFMLGELPNSFVKRRLGIAAGDEARAPGRRTLFAVIDRLDSTLATLLVASVLVTVSPATWAWTLLIGVFAHALFSVLLHRRGVKARAL